MCMHVGQHPQLVFPTILSECRVADRMELDGPVLIGIGVEIVVADISADFGSVPLPGAEQEGAALAAAGASRAQSQEQIPPHEDRQSDRRCEIRRQDNLRK